MPLFLEPSIKNIAGVPCTPIFLAKLIFACMGCLQFVASFLGVRSCSIISRHALTGDLLHQTLIPLSNESGDKMVVIKVYTRILFKLCSSCSIFLQNPQFGSAKIAICLLA